MFRRICVLLWLATATVAVADNGKVYTWTDQTGRVHYSDQAQLNAHEVKKSAPISAQGQTGPKPAPDVIAEGDTRAQDCQRKREQLVTYQHASKVTETDALGNTREYSPEEQKKLIDLTQTSIHDLCSPE